MYYAASEDFRGAPEGFFQVHRMAIGCTSPSVDGFQDFSRFGRILFHAQSFRNLFESNGLHPGIMRISILAKR